MHQSTYPPLDVLKPIAENIWIVDSGPFYVLGIPIPVRMTVVRLSSGELVLHSPTRFSDALRNELEAKGRIAHLIAPNSAHWCYLLSWSSQCPGATIWAAPGLRNRSAVKASK